MRITTCLRGERAASLHFVKVWSKNFWSEVACKQIGVSNLILWFLETNLTHLGWLSKAFSQMARCPNYLNGSLPHGGRELAFVGEKLSENLNRVWASFEGFPDFLFLSKCFAVVSDNNQWQHSLQSALKGSNGSWQARGANPLCKHTGRSKYCGKTESRGTCVGVSLLNPDCSAPRLRGCLHWRKNAPWHHRFFLRARWERRKRRAGGVGSLSLKKTTCELSRNKTDGFAVKAVCLSEHSLLWNCQQYRYIGGSILLQFTKKDWAARSNKGHWSLCVSTPVDQSAGVPCASHICGATFATTSLGNLLRNLLFWSTG